MTEKRRLLFVLVMVVCAFVLAALVGRDQKKREESQRDVQARYSALAYVAPGRGTWDKGYEHGYKFGRLTAISRKPVPSEESLRAAALKTASDTALGNKEEFATGFCAGFAQGYKAASTLAL